MELKTVSSKPELELIALAGEMDLYTADRLKNYVSQHFSQFEAPLVVDMRQLAYIDSSGIAALLHACNVAKIQRIES